MDKIVIKIISIISLMLIIIMTATTCFADVDPGSLTGKGTGVDTSKIQSIGSKIAGVLRAVGIVASVVILMILGLKYMIGSTEEKARYKESMLPYFIGAICIFAAATIATVVYNFANGF